MRKKQLIVSAAGVLGLAAASASAQMLYEPFDYGSSSAGTYIGNLNNTDVGYVNPMSGMNWYDWGTSITSSPFEVSLAGGSSLSNTTTTPFLQQSYGSYADAPFADSTLNSRSISVQPHPYFAATSGTVYYSMNLQIRDLAGCIAFNGINSNNGGFIAALSVQSGTNTSSNPAVSSARLSIRLDPTDATSTHYQLGIKGNVSKPPPDLEFAWDTTQSYTTSDTVFLVASFTNANSGTAGYGVGESRLWVNPNPTSFGAATAPLSASVNQVDTTIDAGLDDGNYSPELIKSLVLRTGNTLIAGWSMDEVRMDTSWAGVTMPKGTTWAGAPGGDFNTGGNWDTTTVPNGVNGNGVPAFVNFRDAGAGTVNVSSPVTLGGINIRSTTSYNLTGSQITLDGTAGGQGWLNVYAENDGTTPALIASSHTIANDVNLATATAANIATGQTLSLSGVVSGSQLKKYGGGTLALTNSSNSFTGDVVIGDGEIAITNDAQLGPIANTVALNGGGLRFDAAMTLDAGRTVKIVGYKDPHTLGAYANDALKDGVGILDTNGNNVTVPGVVSGVNATVTTSLTKRGLGILTLSNTNNDFIGTFVDGGEVSVTSDNAAAGGNAQLGTVPAGPNVNLTFSNMGMVQINGTFDLNPNRIINLSTQFGGGIDVTAGNTSNLPQRVFGAGSFYKAGAGTLVMGYTGTDGYSGATNITGGILQVSNTANIGQGNLGNDVNLSGGGTLQATANISNPNRNLSVNGTGGTIDTGINAVDFGTAGSTVSGEVTGTGVLTKAGSGSLTVEKISSLGGLTVNAGTVAVRARTGNINKPVYIHGALNIAGGSSAPTATLDLNDNDLVVDNAAFSDIQNLLINGYSAAPVPGKTGIISSTSQASGGLTWLVAVDNALANYTEWPTNSAVSVDPNATIVKYTYFGDTNLDGQVTAADYNAVDVNIGSAGVNPGQAILLGDTNRDYAVTTADYNSIDTNIGLGVGNPLAAASLSAVPEPASLSLIGLGAVGLLARRRRRKA